MLLSLLSLGVSSAVALCALPSAVFTGEASPLNDSLRFLAETACSREGVFSGKAEPGTRVPIAGVSTISTVFAPRGPGRGGGA